ncbi:efflux RND transporter periplasmic adaptor subunit [Actinoplanes sp. Pm04-4]|uniref:Efflux RND transporter periplasmic adaptor subunit n=1 Tax=Paractinoplanes pyxinae TaxID=2997416 RepID=A0ABT4B989_9ACTN|nr:efflux RND transporter periplasmic adaptor subunit [Actinoplanes pyxinae]MCY1143057.1 efflux RND transporter periplasmic adaptor subunit [Actinoplanes pyxinae]
MRRSSVVVPVAAALLVAGGGTYAVVRHRPAPVEAASDPVLATTRVRRVDLSDTRTLPGTLGFGAARTIKGTGDGVLTKLPAAGSSIVRGKRLFRVNDQPVTVFYGSTPMFRAIDKTGLTGSDVRQLRRNLDVLGYRTWARHREVADQPLLDALKRWQKDLKLPAPGVLRPGQVVVVDGPGRVDTVTAALGDPAAGPVLTMTSTSKVVTVPMSPTDAGTVRTGTKVTVVMPDGKPVAGSVTAVSRTVSESEDGAPPKVTVVVKPARADYDAAPVQVKLTTITRRKVLAVPVGALVALREGGYALQRPDGSLVPARTGVFARGMVEVSGVAEDTAVVTTP